MRVFSWDLWNKYCTKTCLMRLVITQKPSLASALATASVAAHFPSFKETDADDTKGSFDSRSCNCPVSFADLVIDVKLFRRNCTRLHNTQQGL